MQNPKLLRTQKDQKSFKPSYICSLGSSSYQHALTPTVKKSYIRCVNIQLYEWWYEGSSNKNEIHGDKYIFLHILECGYQYKELRH